MRAPAAAVAAWQVEQETASHVVGLVAAALQVKHSSGHHSLLAGLAG